MYQNHEGFMFILKIMLKFLSFAACGEMDVVVREAFEKLGYKTEYKMPLIEYRFID